MNDHLLKAKRCLDDASKYDVDLEAESVPKAFLRLIDLASVQACIAQAEILERLCNAVEQQVYQRISIRGADQIHQQVYGEDPK